MGNDPLTADAKSENLESWALVEIFGHDKIAGLVTSRKFGSSIMFQVDVPNAGAPGFHYSRLLNPNAIFSIQPTNEEWCRRWVKDAQGYGLKSPLPFIPEPRQISAAYDEDPESENPDTNDTDS